MKSKINMALIALCATVFVLLCLSIVAEGIFVSPRPDIQGYRLVADASTASDAAASSTGGNAGAQAMPDFATRLAKADASAGEAVFRKCVSCHSAAKDGPNKVGPHLWDVVGRPIASANGYSYSAAMKQFSQGGSQQWSVEKLDQFLQSPKKLVPGTSMSFAGLQSEDDRANLIAYLKSQGGQ